MNNGPDPMTIYAFLGYLLLVTSIGLYAAKFSSSGISAYFVGARRMNKFVVALSAVVSGRSAWLLLGVTGMAYKMGASAVWAVLGYIIVELFLFLFYAYRLRQISEEYDCITLPDFFAARFNDRDNRLRVLLVLVISMFMISYVSAQFVGGGKAFAASFGIDQQTGVLLTAGIVLFYTMVGGFLAVSLTDVFQAFFMLTALVMLPVIAIYDFGGLQAILEQLNSIDPSLVDPFSLSFGAAIGFLAIGLGSPGNPHIIARYMSIKDPEQLRITAVIGTLWNVIMGWGALFIGLAGRVYFPEIDLLPGADTENLYPVLARQHLHPLLLGIVVASIFAAIMSTADSQLLVAASALVRDLYDKVIHREDPVPDRKLVMLSRIAVFALVLVSLLMGFIAQDLVFWLVLFAWAGLGAALGPTSVLALYWRGTTRAGVFAGVISGTLTTIIWFYVPVFKSFIYELVPAFIISSILTIAVSKFTRDER